MLAFLAAFISICDIWWPSAANCFTLLGALIWFMAAARCWSKVSMYIPILFG
jgi:hypothetical protein